MGVQWNSCRFTDSNGLKNGAMSQKCYCTSKVVPSISHSTDCVLLYELFSVHRLLTHSAEVSHDIAVDLTAVATRRSAMEEAMNEVNVLSRLELN